MEVFYSFERVQLDDMIDFPLDEFEVLATGAGEVTFIEISPVGVFEISGKIAGGVRQLVCLVANQQVVTAAEGGPIRLEAANRLILQRFHEGILGIVSDWEKEGFPLEIGLEVRGVALELILPAERRVASNDFIVLSEAESEGVLVGIADLMELFDAEVMVAGAEDEFEADLIVKEAGDCI